MLFATGRSTYQQPLRHNGPARALCLLCRVGELDSGRQQLPCAARAAAETAAPAIQQPPESTTMPVSDEQTFAHTPDAIMMQGAVPVHVT